VKPLHVALIVKNNSASRERDRRQAGYFSYAVPEFTWEHLSPGKQSQMDTRALKRAGFDVILHEDGGNWGAYLGSAIPVIYYAVDSTLSTAHLAQRQEQAARADLVLVDHDRLERFAARRGKPALRWGYCVNDRLFYPREKGVDVAYHCNSGGVAHSRRAEVRALLREWSGADGYSLSTGHLDVVQYAEALGRARVVVNLPQFAGNRPHRVLDAMASGAALLTAPVPDVSGEDRRAGTHYAEWQDTGELRQRIAAMLDEDGWREYADAGYAWVMAGHTWAVRARELRSLIYEELKL
jgi:spore maturation protein CgeB